MVERSRLAIGLSIGLSPREPIRRVELLARAAEDAGFDSMAVIDSQLIMKDAYAALVLAAIASSRLHIGTGVTNPVTRDESVIANSFLALSELAPGRIFLGIGSGATAVTAIGRSPAKVAELEASVMTIRHLMAGEEVEIRGQPVRLLNSVVSPPPIFISATQPRMLELAGRIADGVILMGSSTPELVNEQLAHLLSGAEQAGRRREDIEIDLWQTVSVSDNPRTALDDVKSWVASQAWWSLRSAEAEARGVTAREVEKTREQYDVYSHLSRHAPHRDLVSDEFANRMAVAGDVPACVMKLTALARLGVDRLTLTLLSGGRLRRLVSLAEVANGVRGAVGSSGGDGPR